MCAHKKQINVLEKEFNAVDSLNISVSRVETLNSQINMCPSNICSMPLFVILTGLVSLLFRQVKTSYSH